MQFWSGGIWAEADTGLLVGVGALVTAAVAGVTAILTTLFNNKRQIKKDVVDQLNVFIGTLQASNERKDAVITQYQTLIGHLTDETSDCREESAETYGHLRLLHTMVCQDRAALRKLGVDPGPDPLLPPRRERRATADVQFLARQAAQSAALLQEADQTAKASGSLPPAPKGV